MITLESEIARVLVSTKPLSDERRKALRLVRWVIASPDGKMVSDRYERGPVLFTNDLADARVFNGLDSETTKLKFYSALAGEALCARLI